MHIFANTDTRIINLDGTIIIITLFKSIRNKYRIMIDGMEVGYLEEINGVLQQSQGIQIQPTILEKINDFATRNKLKLRDAG